MSSSIFNPSKRPVENLSKKNWRNVFVELKLWFQSKGLFYVCEIEKEEYCSQKDSVARNLTDIETLSAAVAALHVQKDKGPNPQDAGQANRDNLINYERSIQWEKDSSAVMYWLGKCCPDDLDTIEDNLTPKTSWDALYAKYSKVKAS